MKHIQDDMFTDTQTAVELTPREISLIKKAKQLYDYDLTITSNSCKNCIHRKKVEYRQMAKCRLFGFRTSNEKVCTKHRIG